MDSALMREVYCCTMKHRTIYEAMRRKNMGYTPKSLGHVNIYVRNAAQSREWYEDLLGLHTYDFTSGRAAFMSAGLDVSHEK